jgi:microcystin-dependent protein
MSCNNCYNGCTEIISDRCVKYTGIAVPALGIQNGDTLSSIEQSLITFLLSALDGTGIKIDLSGINICTIVQSYLPTSGDITIVDISKALIQTACDLQEQVDVIVSELTILNADYTIGCLEGVTASSDTHSIVQAVITKLCALELDLVALTLDLETNYVRLDEIDALIAAYIDGEVSTTKYYNRMIPFAVVEYYGPIAGNFDGTGAGLTAGNWEKIYLCNGLNGTPDKRGVVGVGITDGTMLGNTMPSIVIPSAGNPTYSLSSIVNGTNFVTLSTLQIPAHSHATTVTEVPHSHTYTQYTLDQEVNDTGNGVRALNKNNTQSGSFTTGVSSTGVNVTNSSTGGGESHVNYQPGLGCYYIQYRP